MKPSSFQALCCRDAVFTAKELYRDNYRTIRLPGYLDFFLLA